jgi:hypothetical protein
MSRRLRRLRDWPECLKRLPDDELRKEWDYWQYAAQTLGHAEARKGCAKRARDVEKEMDRRETEAAGD